MVTMISAQNALFVSCSQDSLNGSQSYLSASATSALLKMNCQITPRITPPMRFGTKKKVRKKFLLRSFEVTISASPNATALTRMSETTTKRAVNFKVDQNLGSANESV